MAKQAKRKNYKQLTLKATGMTEAEYKREYTTYSARVRNYNRVAGTNISPAQQFYYSKRYADNLSPLQMAIAQTPATRARQAGTYPISQTTQNIVRGELYRSWEGAINKSATIRSYWESYNRGELTLAEFSRLARKWSDDRREKIETGDPTVGS